MTEEECCRKAIEDDQKNLDLKCWNCGGTENLTKAHIFNKVNGKRVGRSLSLCRNCHDMLDYIECDSCGRKILYNSKKWHVVYCRECREQERLRTRQKAEELIDNLTPLSYMPGNGKYRVITLSKAIEEIGRIFGDAK